MKNIYVGNVPIIEQGGSTFNINTKLKNAVTLDSLFLGKSSSDIETLVKQLAADGKIFYARGVVKYESGKYESKTAGSLGNYFVDTYASVIFYSDSSTSSSTVYGVGPCIQFCIKYNTPRGSFELPGVGKNSENVSGPLYKTETITNADGDKVYVLKKDTEFKIGLYSSGMYITSTADLQIWVGDAPD